MSKVSKSDTIEIGEKIIHPLYGIGVVEDFKKMNVLNEEQGFYVLNIKTEKLSLMIPERDVKKGAIRKPSSREMALEAIETLKKQPNPISDTSINLFFREYSEKLKNGNILDLAEVVRDFSKAEVDIDVGKEIKKFLRRAKKVLIQELSIALDQKEYQITRTLNKISKSAARKK